MEGDFITIKEAAELTGWSAIKIRRLVVSQDTAQDTTQDTTQNQVIRQKTATGFIYKISKEWILKEAGQKEPVKEPEEEQTESPDNSLISFLKEELRNRNKQIDQLIERDRETNVLLNRLQERVFLLEEPKKPEEEKQPEEQAENRTEESVENRDKTEPKLPVGEDSAVAEETP